MAKSSRVYLAVEEAEYILHLLNTYANGWSKLKGKMETAIDKEVEPNSSMNSITRLGHGKLPSSGSISNNNIGKAVLLSDADRTCAIIEAKVATDDVITEEEEEFYFNFKGYRIV